jgi:hypothetical protein
MTTGIFYHPSFSRRSYLTVGARLADFPGALASERSANDTYFDFVARNAPHRISQFAAALTTGKGRS